MTSIKDLFSQQTQLKKEEVYTLDEYLSICKNDKMAYATAAERMLKAIGEPEKVVTANDPKLSRIFQTRVINRYRAFDDFYGMEDTIDRLVSFFKHAAQGLEEKKQVLYLLGPVGSAKSSLAERLKELMETFPIYVLAYDNELSPVFESPLGLFSSNPALVSAITNEYGIPSNYFKGIIPSPWAVKRLKQSKNDLSKFKVVKVWPNKLDQVGIVKTEPGDENNQDISSLVGKVNIRMLEHFDQSDVDAYSFSGGLCRGNQGMLEFVEMFKAPIKVLHPLLTATQEGNYKGTEDGFGAIPFNGVILAHSNESEWTTFKNNKNNEAFLDRVYIVKVPYCLRRDEEIKIYQKMLDSSNLGVAKCAPKTLELMANFAILTRLREHKNSTLISKMRVYNGENLKDKDPRAKTLQEYKDEAGVDEGMEGVSTRFAFKVLSKTFNFDPDEVAADPVHLFNVLETAIKHEQFDQAREQQYLTFIKEHMVEDYKEYIGNEIQKAYLSSYSDYGQALFDRYIMYADHWVQDIDYRDPDTGQMFDRAVLNAELEKIEKPAGISNPKDFRAEVVNFVLRAKAGNNGKNPSWTSYEKMREVIEKKMFASSEDLLPVISFGQKANKDEDAKHSDFVNRMVERGYTLSQTRRLVEWYIRLRKGS